MEKDLNIETKNEDTEANNSVSHDQNTNIQKDPLEMVVLKIFMNLQKNIT